MSKDVNNINVLITGATSGIGEALVNHYVNKNYIVTACGRNQTKLNELAAITQNTLAFDVNNETEIEQASQQVKNLDTLILNAGDCRYIDDPMQFDADLFADIINTNLISLGKLLKYFLPKVKKGGQVVFISSSATILPFPKAQAYGASKAGVDYLADSLRLDLVFYDISVTLVHPGFVRTPLTSVNDFDMPFMISPEDAAQRIFTGIKKKKQYLHFPKRLTLTLKLLSVLPTCIWQRLILKSSSLKETQSRDIKK
jgi:short-subunit dehydrogenase